MVLVSKVEKWVCYRLRSGKLGDMSEDSVIRYSKRGINSHDTVRDTRMHNFITKN
jgi:hypothetical protein